MSEISFSRYFLYITKFDSNSISGFYYINKHLSNTIAFLLCQALCRSSERGSGLPKKHRAAFCFFYLALKVLKIPCWESAIGKQEVIISVAITYGSCFGGTALKTWEMWQRHEFLRVWYELVLSFSVSYHKQPCFSLIACPGPTHPHPNHVTPRHGNHWCLGD